MNDEHFELAMQTIEKLAENTNQFAIVSKDSIEKLAEKVSNRIDGIDTKLGALEKGIIDIGTKFNNLPLQSSDIDKITSAKNKKVINLLGGKNSNAYRNGKDSNGKSIRARVYSDINVQIQREFGVSSYKFIRSNQTEMVLSFIEKYDLPYELKETVAFVNSQMRFEF